MKKISFLLLLSAFLTSCFLFKPKPAPYEPDEPGWDIWSEEAEGYKLPYRAAATRHWNLVHTALDLTVDIRNETIGGTADIKLTPHARPQDSIILDAKLMRINSIMIKESRLTGDFIPTPYYQDEDTMQVVVKLTEKSFDAGDTIVLRISYQTLPKPDLSGGWAINQNKGIYFIDPKDEDPDMPAQVWTQGETESNSQWFPTIDKPNQKMTQTISITYPDTLISLSNGDLLYSTRNAGKRTDVWEQNLPHAPYLTMLAIGNWRKVGDYKEGDLPVHYYVEKAYEPYAKLVFGETPRMIKYFSGLTGMPYPWDKYDQVVVRNFVSGAMENTGAVIHNSVMQHNAREHKDQTHEDYISHELFHHWFGNLVTCESWSNLTLNEGFASYGEYLWREHRYGKDNADEHRADDLATYMGNAFIPSMTRPVVDFHYAFRDDMFDAHSYQKGALVLHHLRKYLGDRTFFAGVQLYLKKHAYSTVEIHDLRKAFETVSGEDLNWFFNQWFLERGHPVIHVSPHWTDPADGEPGVFTLKLSREWEGIKRSEDYRIPLKILIANGNTVKPFAFNFDGDDSYFTVNLDKKPDWFEIDGDNALPGRIMIEKGVNDYGTGPDFGDEIKRITSKLKTAPEAFLRVAALDELFLLYESLEADSVLIADILTTAMKDKSAWVRKEALHEVFQWAVLSENMQQRLRPAVEKLAFDDPDNMVRTKAVRWLSNLEDPSLDKVFVALTLDSSIAVATASMQAIKDRDLALRHARAGIMNPEPALAFNWASLLVSDFFHDGLPDDLKPFLNNDKLGKSDRIRKAVGWLADLNDDQASRWLTILDAWLFKPEFTTYRPLAAKELEAAQEHWYYLRIENEEEMDEAERLRMANLSKAIDNLIVRLKT